MNEWINKNKNTCKELGVKINDGVLSVNLHLNLGELTKLSHWIKPKLKHKDIFYVISSLRMTVLACC